MLVIIALLHVAILVIITIDVATGEHGDRSNILAGTSCGIDAKLLKNWEGVRWHDENKQNT